MPVFSFFSSVTIWKWAAVCSSPNRFQEIRMYINNHKALTDFYQAMHFQMLIYARTSETVTYIIFFFFNILWLLNKWENLFCFVLFFYVVWEEKKIIVPATKMGIVCHNEHQLRSVKTSAKLVSLSSFYPFQL